MISGRLGTFGETILSTVPIYKHQSAFQVLTGIINTERVVFALFGCSVEPDTLPAFAAVHPINGKSLISNWQITSSAGPLGTKAQPCDIAPGYSSECAGLNDECDGSRYFRRTIAGFLVVCKMSFPGVRRCCNPIPHPAPNTPPQTDAAHRTAKYPPNPRP